MFHPLVGARVLRPGICVREPADCHLPLPSRIARNPLPRRRNEYTESPGCICKKFVYRNPFARSCMETGYRPDLLPIRFAISLPFDGDNGHLFAIRLTRSDTFQAAARWVQGFTVHVLQISDYASRRRYEEPQSLL